MIAPLSDALEEMQIDTLVFSFDQGLRGLPVAALYDGQQFLIEQYSMSIMPSVSLTDTRYAPVKNLPVLAMGASTFNHLSPLPGVPMELKTITSNWPGEMFLNEEFTLENFQQQRIGSGYKIVHLATHAEFDVNDINKSYVQLWDRQQIGFEELRDLDLEAPQVELLVLSACRTAVGSELAELGFAGLAVKTGAKSAIASLCYVSDDATLGLMSEFYHQLNLATIKAEAIRQAQIALLRQEVTIQDGQLITSNGTIPLPANSPTRNMKFWHPYYWSGFTTVGSPW